MTADEVLALLKRQDLERAGLRGRKRRSPGALREAQRAARENAELYPVGLWLPGPVLNWIAERSPDPREHCTRAVMEPYENFLTRQDAAGAKQSISQSSQAYPVPAGSSAIEASPAGAPAKGAIMGSAHEGNEFERAADLNAARAKREAERPAFKLPPKPDALVKAERALAAAHEVREARRAKLGRYPITDADGDQVAGDELARLRKDKEFADTAKRIEAAYVRESVGQDGRPGRLFSRAMIYNAVWEAALAEVQADVNAAEKKVREARERWVPTAVAALFAAHTKKRAELLKAIYGWEDQLEPMIEALVALDPSAVLGSAIADDVVRARQWRQALEWSC